VLITGYPAVLGSDMTAVVVATGADCTKLQVGDHVFGCVPVGISAFSPFQETFLVEEEWVFKKGPEVGLEEACTIGAGILVSTFCLFI
jgi:NADPH:quinone reductase-like Zn-dependent oxidoreductase